MIPPNKKVYLSIYVDILKYTIKTGESQVVISENVLLQSFFFENFPKRTIFNVEWKSRVSKFNKTIMLR